MQIIMKDYVAPILALDLPHIVVARRGGRVRECERERKRERASDAASQPGL